MLLKRFCFRKAQPVTPGTLYPYRIVSQSRRSTGSGGRCATRVVNIMNHVQYRRVLKKLPLQEHILDIDFKNGNTLKRVLKEGCCSVCGTGISENCMTAVERKLLPSLQQGYLKFVMGNVESLPLTDACMDTVHSIDTIYFWESLDKGLYEIARIFKLQGTLLLVFYDKRFTSCPPLREYGFQLYGPKDVKAALKHNGYTSIGACGVKRERSYCTHAKHENAQERRA